MAKLNAKIGSILRYIYVQHMLLYHNLVVTGINAVLFLSCMHMLMREMCSIVVQLISHHVAHCMLPLSKHMCVINRQLKRNSYSKIGLSLISPSLPALSFPFHSSLSSLYTHPKHCTYSFSPHLHPLPPRGLCTLRSPMNRS